MNRTAEAKAYKRFITEGMTAYGACALIGNLEAESDGFCPDRVEYLCLQRLRENSIKDATGKNYTDTTYTAAVDSGRISRATFLNPLPGKQYGYGLPQWTTPARKAGLYDLAKSRCVSIADIDMQTDYLISELKSKFPTVLQVLKTATSIKAASDIVLVKFEAPANADELKASRAARGQEFYNYVSKEENSMNKQEAINKVIAIAKAEVGYLEKKSNSQLDSKTANAGSNNYTKYWRDVYPSYQAQAWCACFVSWVLMKAFGQDPAKKLLKHWPYVYCPTLGSLFTKHANPEVGDIVIFYRNGVFAHTGIVTSVNGDKFTTIEGNASGASGITPNGGGVVEKSYLNSQLPGTKFCRPDWSLVASVGTITAEQANINAGTCQVTLKCFIKGNQDPQLKTVQKLLNDLGYKGKDGKILTVDGLLGDNTMHAVDQFQKAKKINASNPGTVAAKTWAALING